MGTGLRGCLPHPRALLAKHTGCPHDPLLLTCLTQGWRSLGWPHQRGCSGDQGRAPRGVFLGQKLQHPTKNPYQQFVHLFKT